ncbi:MAG: hypothetical protein M3R13_05740 [Armatimonadota bacterium]|nr:hypothetical protein [Armatimonadota bacterium]
MTRIDLTISLLGKVSSQPCRKVEYDLPVELKFLIANLAAATALSLLSVGCAKAESEEDIVGEWQYHAVGINKADASLGANEMVRESRVTLRSDHTYEWDLAGYKTSGTWDRMDKIVTFTSRTPHPYSDVETPRVVFKVRVEGKELVVIPIGGTMAQGSKYWFERVERDIK